MSRYDFLPTYKSDGVRYFAIPKMPDLEDYFDDILYDEYVWKNNDRLDKVAYKFYNDEKLWWVIAWFNHVPDEALITSGRVVLIPRNPEYIFSLFSVENKKVTLV